MDSRLGEALGRITAEAFGTLGFMFPLGVLEPGTPLPDGAVTARVGFTGPAEGTVELTVAPEVLPELAANMTGADEPPGEAEQRDALGEMVNVICGNVLPDVGDPAAVYDVAAPEVGPAETIAEPFAVAGLVLDGGPVRVALAVHRQAPAPAE